MTGQTRPQGSSNEVWPPLHKGKTGHQPVWKQNVLARVEPDQGGCSAETRRAPQAHGAAAWGDPLPSRRCPGQQPPAGRPHPRNLRDKLIQTSGGLDSERGAPALSSATAWPAWTLPVGGRAAAFITVSCLHVRVCCFVFSFLRSSAWAKQRGDLNGWADPAVGSQPRALRDRGWSCSRNAWETALTERSLATEQQTCSDVPET